MTDSGPSLDQIKRAMRAMWMAGDFGVVAKEIGGSAGEPFAASLPIRDGMKVLDVACGTGNVSLALARAGAVVTGLDLAPNLLEQARARAAAEGLAIRFDEGDAEALPYPDGEFDAVTSMFGAMFAPRPEVVAQEMARVLRPGGLLAMANWTPEGFSGRLFRVSGRHVPPPPGVPAPVLWGGEATVRARLERDFEQVQMERVLMEFDLPTGPAGAVEFFRTYFGPTKVAFERLDPAGQAAMATELEALWAEANVAEDPRRHVLIHNEYLRVVARRREGDGS